MKILSLVFALVSLSALATTIPFTSEQESRFGTLENNAVYLDSIDRKMPSGMSVVQNALLVLPSIVGASTVTLTTSASVGTSTVQIVPYRATRKAFTLYNNGANSCYCVFGPVSTSAAPTFILATFATFVWNGSTIYTGPISCLRNAGTGTITVTEL